MLQKTRTDTNHDIDEYDEDVSVNSFSQTFDKSQISAIQADINVPLIISAGPGSGKTRTLCGRLVFMLENGVKAYECLTLTFSKKAAVEMESRIDLLSVQLPGYDTQSIKVSTFHAFCLGVLHQNEDRLRPEMRPFTIATRSQQLSFVKEAVAKWNFSITKGAVLTPDDPRNEKLMKKELCGVIMNWVMQQKARGIKSQLLTAHNYHYFYEYYENQLAANRLIDYTDMILETVSLFENNPDLVDRYSNRWKYVLVDEFQDVNPSQFQLLVYLTKNHSNITVVGDVDQSIYAFRGGTSKVFAMFRENYTNYEERQLQINYRSTQIITDASQGLIQNNISRSRKTITSANEEGDLIQLASTHSKEEEIDLIARKIQRIVETKQGTYRDIAILSRVHKNILTSFEEELKKRNIPFIRHRKKGFSDREIVRIMLSYLSLLVNEYDDESFRKVINIPSRGIGEASLLYLENYRKEAKKKNRSLLQTLRTVIEAGYPKTKANEKLNAKTKKGFEHFVELIDELKEKCGEVDIPTIITSVADRIGCKSYAEKARVREEKDRNRRQRVKEIRKQRNDAVEGDDYESDSDDLELEYNTDENLALMVANSTIFTEARYNLKEQDCLTPSERIDLLKEYIDVTRGEEDEREIMEKQTNPDAITITSIHGAKGLEWKHVFIVRVNQGILPISYNPERDTDSQYDNKQEHYEEERRLFYVALSRAQKTAHISYVVANEKDRPSYFLKEIRREFVQSEDQKGDDDVPKQRPSAQQFTAARSLLATSQRDQANSGVRKTFTPVAIPARSFNQPPRTVSPLASRSDQKPSIPQTNAPRPIIDRKPFKAVPIPATIQPKRDQVQLSSTATHNQPRPFKPVVVPPVSRPMIPSNTRPEPTTTPPRLFTSNNVRQPVINPSPRSINPPQPPHQSQKSAPTAKRARETQPFSQMEDFADGFLFDDLFDDQPSNSPQKKKPRNYL